MRTTQLHTERGTYGQQYINISPPPPMTDTTLSTSTRTPLQVVNIHKSGPSGSLRISPITKAYQNRKCGNPRRLVNTPHAYSLQAWSQRSHPSLSALCAKSRPFKIYHSNHMQHDCSLITVMSMLRGKHYTQTNSKSNEGRTEWDQNRKGCQLLCCIFYFLIRKFLIVIECVYMHNPLIMLNKLTRFYQGIVTSTPFLCFNALIRYVHFCGHFGQTRKNFYM